MTSLGRLLVIISMGANAALLTGMVPNIALAQVTSASEDDIKEAPKPFQDLLRGKRTTIDQTAGGPGGPPPGGSAAAQPKRQPSSDPHDIHGAWSVKEMLGVAGEMSKTKDGKRPGPRANTIVEVNRICWVNSGIAPATATIYQDDQRIIFVKDNDLRVRRIYLNDVHPQNIVPTYSGHSIAHWEGDTLVVDTVGLEGALQVEDFDLEAGAWKLIMATPTLHVVERIKKIDNGAKLQSVVSFDDTATGMEPYTITYTADYAPGSVSLEAECEDFNDAFGPGYPGDSR